ncbi:MAG: EamA-like transporter family protein [Leptolyngbyaceae cyanobacterium SM2_5_2]|nr:EamA-like transporter family protein [Leptolyngbyaceae cyanobacterium SM2_5_2]
MGNLGVLALAILGGLATALQGQFMGVLTTALGPLESVFITYLGGTLIATVVMITIQGGNLKAWSTVPWYALTTGLMGLLIVGSIGYVVPRLGLAAGFTAMVAAQFIGGAIIDHYGLFHAAIRPMDGPKVLGMALLMVGVALLVR